MFNYDQLIIYRVSFRLFVDRPLDRDQESMRGCDSDRKHRFQKHVQFWDSLETSETCFR